MRFDSVESAVADIRRGRPVVVVDDESRENEGDVVFAASKSTPAKINFLARHARGLICVALSADRVEKLSLPPMTDRNRARHETAFTVSVEAREGVTTGISAADRSLTARKLADESLGPDAFVSPGHTFPLKARRGGVLVRAGHTEAAVDLVEMAGLGCAGVICEILKANGTMARLPDCGRFARRHGLKIISVASLIHHRHM
ncbi:MAG TPA: 3,4-dihydroxy-2-butanone-4-phosphate synthase, partial [Fibrobacteria bacterium]|nr:3,4-dihydroxy-2-butanone-4-phosphate synthase [Fibrobacteria bacterium]